MQDLLRLAVTGPESRSDETVINIGDNSTSGFDRNLYAYKLVAAGSQTPQLYSQWNCDDYSINSIPGVTAETIILLKILCKQDGGHSIALTELNNYNYTYPVMLYNPATEELVELENVDYSFNAKEGETINLLLCFSNNTVGVKNFT
nr:hypothetical protein [uncultured Draconibacterium sp.]